MKLAMTKTRTTQTPNDEAQDTPLRSDPDFNSTRTHGPRPGEEEDMIKPNEGAKSPKLEQLQTNIVLGLQELQDQVAKHGSLLNFAYDSRLRWDDTPDGYWLEWDPDESKISFVSEDDVRPDDCIFLGHWVPWYKDSLSLGPTATNSLDEVVQDWTKFVTGRVDARTLINLLRCDMIPSDIEFDALGLSLMDLILGLYRWGGGGHPNRFGLNHTLYAPVLETILSYYLIEVGPAEITDCEGVHDVAEWLSVVRNQGPGTQRFLELVAQL